MRKKCSAPAKYVRIAAIVLAILSANFAAPANRPAADSNWRRQTSNSFAELRAVFFLDQKIGWAAGGRGTLLRTEDGGANWQAQKKPSDDTIRDVLFWDRQDGWLLCERNIFLMKSMDEARSYLLHTTDGGSNWERIDVDGVDADTRFTRLLRAGDRKAWLLGEAGNLYLTNDRGRSWKRQVPPTRYLLLGGTFFDTDHGWLTGGGASVIRTIDGGAVWRTTVVRNAPGARFNAIAFASENRGWVVGDGGRIMTTGDGGRTWTPQVTGTDEELFDVRFLDQREGWVVGGHGTLLHTRDGGAHWTEIETGVGHLLERILVLDRTHGWVVGLGGTILSLTPPGSDRPPVLRRN